MLLHWPKPVSTCPQSSLVVFQDGQEPITTELVVTLPVYRFLMSKIDSVELALKSIFWPCDCPKNNSLSLQGVGVERSLLELFESFFSLKLLSLCDPQSVTA